MPDSPPTSPPNQETPNPNPNSDPCEKSSSFNPEIKNPSPEINLIQPQKNLDPDIDPVDQDPQDSVDDQDEIDQEQEQQQIEEGIKMYLSSPNSCSNKGTFSRKNAVKKSGKRKKGNFKKRKASTQKKMEALFTVFKPIPFNPAKVLDFNKHEENLRSLGLWDFAHIEFDKNVRVDLIVEMFADFSKKSKVSYVGSARIGISRAAVARALKLPGKIVGGVVDEERFPAEFLAFLEEFVENYMLLHETDLWITPDEVVNWMQLIKEGQPQRVDWAGMMWFMMEKELAQGMGLKECYYVSHWQQLIKVQKEFLLTKESKVEMGSQKGEEIVLEDDEDGGDSKMLDAEEASFGEEKQEVQSVEVALGQESVTQVESAGAGAADVEQKDGGSDMVQKDGDSEMLQKDGDSDMVLKDGNSDIVQECGDSDMVHKNDNASVAEKEGNGNMVNKYDDANVSEKDGDTAMMEKAEDVANVDSQENIGGEGCCDEVGKVETLESGGTGCTKDTDNEEQIRDVNMMDFGDGEGKEEGQWLFNGRNDGGQHFLQPCNKGSLNLSVEDGRPDGVSEDAEDEEIEEDGHVEGFKVMQKGSADGMSSANLMQAFETGQLAYPSPELGGHSSLDLMPSRTGDNVMVGGTSIFNSAGKREIDHDVGHHGLDENHKRMRMDGPWDHKQEDEEMCVEQIMHWADKFKSIREAKKAEEYQQATLIQFYSHQVVERDGEIMQLRFKLDEVERSKYAEISRLDRELHLMNSVINGYRRALKETQRQFAEYRRRCQVPDEPIYKDAGKGGVVKSIMELEKERLKEEEKQKMLRLEIEDKFHEHLNGYELQWEEFLSAVLNLEGRLTNAAQEVKVLKDNLAECKTLENAQNEKAAPENDEVSVS